MPFTWPIILVCPEDHLTMHIEENERGQLGTGGEEWYVVEEGSPYGWDSRGVRVWVEWDKASGGPVAMIDGIVDTAAMHAAIAKYLIWLSTQRKVPRGLANPAAITAFENGVT